MKAVANVAGEAGSVSPLVLSSQHTSSFAELLEQLGISIAVTTYQAGKLVLLRALDGAVNTHFRGFNKPMGLALDGGRMAIGTAAEIWEFHNAPAATRALNLAGGRHGFGRRRGRCAVWAPLSC